MKRYNSKKLKKPEAKQFIEYFPRGNNPKDDFSFNTGMIEPSSSSSKLLKHKRKAESKQINQSESEIPIQKDENETTRAMVPKFKIGDLVLLAISEIRKDYMIANYSRNKKAMIHSSYSGLNYEDDAFTFLNYFHIGQFICGAVARPGNDFRLENGHMNKKIFVSIDPKIVNTGLIVSKIAIGMDLYGQLTLDKKGNYTALFGFGESKVKETEDDNEDINNGNRNYIVNLIDNDSEEGKNILKGKILLSYYFFKVVNVKMIKKKYNIDITMDITNNKFAIKKIDFVYIRPGFLFKANVTRDLANGKEISFGGNLGSIFIDHIKSESKTKNIWVRVIHVASSKKLCGLSSLTHIVNLYIDDIENKANLIGQKYNGEIVKDLYGKSYQVSFNTNDREINAFLHNNNIDTKLEVGNKIEYIYIKEYNFFDDCPICTAKEQTNILSWDSICVGDNIECIIKEIKDNEIIVLINSFIIAKIPIEHISDHPLKKIPKKFKIGMKVNTRVFISEPNTKNIVLTMKETLIDNETPLYASIEKLIEGNDIYVVYIGNGLFAHSNNIKGVLLKFKTMKQSDFKIGKLYKYKIYKVDIKNSKVYFTADKDIWLPGCGDYETFIKRNQLMSNIIKVLNTYNNSDNLNEGDIAIFSLVNIDKMINVLIKKGIDASLIEEYKTSLLNEFLIVKYAGNDSNGNYYGFIVKSAISDYFNDEIYNKFVIKKDEIKIKMLIIYHNKDTHTLFVTPKKSLIEHKENIIHFNDDITNLKDQVLDNDKIYYGFVNKISNKGVIVQFYGKKKLIMRNKDLNSNYTQGKTIICRYTNKKFYFDIKAYINYTNEDYYKESEDIFDSYISSFSIVKDIKSKGNTSQKDLDVIIESIEDNFILGKEKNKDSKVYIISNLYNFSLKYSKLPFNIQTGNIIKCKSIKYSNELDGYIAKMPFEILNVIKREVSKYGGNNQRNIGDILTCKINGVKNNSIFALIDKHTIARIDKRSFPGNVDRVQMLLKETINLRKMSTESKESKNSNTPPELKFKGIIINIIETKKKLKIYELAPLISKDKKEELIYEDISTSLDTSGTIENVGIIAQIKNDSKFPLLISIKANIPQKLQIPFSDIPREMINENGILYHIGDKVKFYCNTNYECSLYQIDSKSTEPEIGKVYSSRVLKAISSRGIIIDINMGKSIETFVDICEVTDFLHYNPLEYYKKGQIVKCRIISKDESSNRYFASLRYSIVSDDEYNIITNGSTIQFNQQFGGNSLYDLRNKIMKFGIENSLEINTIAIGYITSSSEKGVFIKLGNNIIARASLNELLDETVSKPYLLFNVNNICLCRVISIYKKDSNDIKINVSLRLSIIKYSLSLHKKDLVLNNFYECDILSKNKKGFVVNIIGSTFSGMLKEKNIKPGSEICIGKHYILQLIKLDKDQQKPKLRFGNLAIDNDLNKDIVINKITDDIINKSKENEDIYNTIKHIIENAKKEKNLEDLIDVTGEAKDNEIDFEELVETTKRRKSSTISKDKEEGDAIEEEQSDIDENDDDNIEIKYNEIITEKEKKFALLTGMGIQDDNNKMEIEEEEKENLNVKSASHREKNNLASEMKTRAIENSEIEEKNAEYYEKLILSDHDNSLSWIQYASYILEKLGPIAARKIFERAIKTIDIAKINEKQNIWVAYMNLENIYGDQETFKSIVERALEVNDKKSIYLHLISIYTLSKKTQLANEIFKILIKDYFADYSVWKKYIEFLFKYYTGDNDDIPNPKEGLNKATQVLPKKKQIEIMVYYAQLLYANQRAEEARNTFDNILKNLPKRSDIWFVYADKEVKFGNVEKAKQIYERMISIAFKKNTLKSVMKKYLEFVKDNIKSDKEMSNAKELVQKIIQERMEEDNDKNDEEENEEQNE